MVSGNGTVIPSARSADINIIVYVYLLPTICVFGIIGNIANITTLLSRRLKAVSYVYLLALAIADLLCMTFVLIFTVDWGLHNVARLRAMSIYYIIVWYRAHMILQQINWAIGSGILVVVCLTVERYMSICWPIVFRMWNSKLRAYLAVTAAYILSFILYIPMFWQFQAALVLPKNSTNMGFNDTSDTPSVQIWKRDDNPIGFFGSKKNDKIYKYIREIIVKIIPIIIIGLLNIQIIIAFRNQKKNRNRMKNRCKDSASRERDDRSLLYLLMAIVAMFFVCNVPAAINLVLINESMRKKPAYKIFRAVANMLEITNHALNFYVFCLCSSDYRTAFLEKFPCVKHFSFHVRRLYSVVFRRNPYAPNRDHYSAIIGYNTPTTRMSGAKRPSENYSSLVIENTAVIVQEQELEEKVLTFNINNRSQSDFLTQKSNATMNNYSYCNSIAHIPATISETDLTLSDRLTESDKYCQIMLSDLGTEACMTIEKEEFV